ncbi:hypothetical protein E6A47_00115 [Brachyspira pilosicoli]|uniref:hypothetical protein n=1 Tax=Brachyspira pilosicoli TaxID=52584 RepID=UPI001CA4BDC3|nr:hypothetical protein [Brachyspira pilosicoli]MBW5398455.1 hypothetical protein [Brachyspira pilosicoli]
MYKGFNFHYSDLFSLDSIIEKIENNNLYIDMNKYIERLQIQSEEDYINLYDEVIEEYKKEIDTKINIIRNNKKDINATDLQNTWFPSVSSHIFLSHSHADENIAKLIAGYLYDKLKLRVFIDSTIWQYANDKLLELIEYNVNWKYLYTDLKVCSIDDVFRFKDNINIMLLMALTKMIDITDCFIFLNTKNSTNMYNDNQTYSPYIYYELGISRYIRKVKRIGRFYKQFSRSTEEMKMIFDLSTDHLIDLDMNSFIAWSNIKKKDFNALEDLYKRYT